MSKAIRNTLIGAAVFGLGMLAIKLLRGKDLKDRLRITVLNADIDVNPNIISGGITFNTKAKLDNPTNNALTFTQPVVYLFTNGNEISHTSPSSKTYTINGLSSIELEKIKITLTWTTIANYASNIYTKIPELVSAVTSQNWSKVAELINMPLEIRYSTYSDGISVESETKKLL